MADVITGSNNTGLWARWPADIQEEMREYWLKFETGYFSHLMKSRFENMMFHNTERSETSYRNVPQVLFVVRTTMAK